MSAKTLTLIDGSGYLFRAFHALPPLANRNGEPTGALFGVFNMLRTTLKARPDYLAFVVDAPGPTFRDELYPDYKAHRPPMPEDLRAQIEPMMNLVAALGIPILRVGGVEADDVIGTLSRQAAKQGIEVTVSTGDKDMAQLVDAHVKLVNTMTNTTLDEAGVVDKFGVRPDQIADYLALTGDAVDNVPGVEKCGPKTAAKWLGEYATLDGVIANADRIGGKIGENLRRALPQLPLSRALTIIKIDVALEQKPTDLVRREADVDKLRELYARYEFKAALKDLDAGLEKPESILSQTDQVGKNEPTHHAAPDSPSPESRVPAPDKHYELVLSQAQFDAWLKRLEAADLICIDTETTGLDPMRAEIVGVSFAVEPGHAAYVPLAHDYPAAPAQLDRAAVLAALRPLLEDAKKHKLGQHAKYDMNVLSNYGIAVQGVRFDSMLESYVWNSASNRHDMDTLAKKYLGVDTIHYEDVTGKGAKQIPFSQVDVRVAADYAAEDADITLRLHEALWARLETEPGLQKVFDEIEMPLVPVLARMEQTGVLIDAARLKKQSNELGKRLLEIQQRAFDVAGRHFSLDSPKQLQALLYDELKLPVSVKTPTGQPSTNEEALEALANQHELPRLILDYRTLAKLRSTYTDKLPEAINPRDGRVHTSYHQAVAATGRLSSNDPNLQNIPIRTEEGRRIRQAFVAPPGCKVLAADYSQIELRIMAHLSGDPGLLAAFHGGQDVHRATAAEVFGVPPEQVDANQRRAAKAINFGLMYGMSAWGLARQLGIDRGEANDYVKRYFERYPGVREFMDRTREQAHRDGYVETLFGRRLYLTEIHSRNQGLRAGAERAAINAPMQGTAADIIKRAMIAVDAWLQSLHDEARMIMQVHDELVFEVREDAVKKISDGVRERMMHAAQLAVPLIVDIGIGDNWDEAH
ncbi:MAG: DNA polymerase I [Proteobacteria bacterium]|uniref:DNA polymerase I n=1 Tax=Rudaea sp. TaxID=2136325 RepID=UPI003783558C|nr:DNA polymerase I [Pseudomonadota bacterium]